ncbi:DUF6799 domain-containing protein [Hymenobacter chitinivorans]|uniref:DUF6799 domain-containing protein n=1 Tax=Hymenobacter chitinivorans TaxID=89969 RepID=UPI000C235462|nr:DUF6799 domain-containing protein [Hymenobacter chitinivorans]
MLNILLLPAASLGQGRADNDGFQRLDGTMYIIRNGVKRPMTQDVRLPNGRVVTPDGVVVSRSGQRTELAEGQGCNLAGAVVDVRVGAQGKLQLATSPRTGAPAGPFVLPAGYRPPPAGKPDKHRGRGHFKKKKHGKGPKHHH